MLNIFKCISQIFYATINTNTRQSKKERKKFFHTLVLFFSSLFSTLCPKIYLRFLSVQSGNPAHGLEPLVYTSRNVALIRGRETVNGTVGGKTVCCCGLNSKILEYVDLLFWHKCPPFLHL